jgi:hypothetical protein
MVWHQSNQLLIVGDRFFQIAELVSNHTEHMQASGRIGLLLKNLVAEQFSLR